jgi:cytochrome c biogenesis factor
LLQGIVKQKVLKLITLLVIFIGAVTLFFPGPALLDPASEFYQQSMFLVKSLGSVSVFSYIPISLFAAGAILFRFIHGKHRFSRSNTSIGLIHAGFIFIVIGAISSTSLSTEGTVDYTTLELNIPKGINTVWSASVTDINTTAKADNESEQVLNLNFYKNGNPHGSGIVSLSKSDRIGYFHKLFVHRTLFADILVHYNGDELNPSSIRLRTEVMPLVNVLWGGAILMIGGIIFLMKPNLSSKTG